MFNYPFSVVCATASSYSEPEFYPNIPMGAISFGRPIDKYSAGPLTKVCSYCGRLETDFTHADCSGCGAAVYEYTEIGYKR